MTKRRMVVSTHDMLNFGREHLAWRGRHGDTDAMGHKWIMQQLRDHHFDLHMPISKWFSQDMRVWIYEQEDEIPLKPLEVEP